MLQSVKGQGYRLQDRVIVAWKGNTLFSSPKNHTGCEAAVVINSDRDLKMTIHLNLAPSDFHLLGAPKNAVHSMKFETDDSVIGAVRTGLCEQKKPWY